MTAHSAPQPSAPDPHSPAEQWEARYAAREAVWSGRVTDALVSVLSDLGVMAADESQPTPPRSLDLGCGEGADVLWLAARGWDALGVDISPTATSRGQRRAEDLGLPARFIAADLTSWAGWNEGPFDLVTASFFQSHAELDRAAILRRALAALADGGHLVLISHAAPPPWSPAGRALAAGDEVSHEHAHMFIDPEHELKALGLPRAEFAVKTAEIRRRNAVRPSGERAELEDTVVVVRRG